jgi:hypothetical protein
MKRRILRGIVVTTLILSVAFVDYAIRGPKAKRRRDGLASTLTTIVDPSDSRTIRTWSGYKTSNAGATRFLVSALPAEEVRSFYVNQLESQGWIVKCERVIRNRDRTVLVRDEDSVLLDLPSLDSSTTGEYFLGLSWGIEYC